MVESRALRRTTIAATYLRCDSHGLGRTAAYEPQSTFMVSLQLRDLPSHPVYHEGKFFPIDTYPNNTLTIHDLRDEWQAELLDPFEVFHCHIPLAALESLADECGARRASNLLCSPAHGMIDLTMRHLVNALLPVLHSFQPQMQLYVDHVLLAMREHMAVRYGGIVPRNSALTGQLAQWQLRRAVDFMRAHLRDEISLEQIAAQCGLSVSYFIRAFKRSTGVTPYQCFLRQRLEAAQQLLRGTMPMTDVAQECGFADQSHFCRAFARQFGMTPGQWRRFHSSAAMAGKRRNSH